MIQRGVCFLRPRYASRPRGIEEMDMAVDDWKVRTTEPTRDGFAPRCRRWPLRCCRFQETASMHPGPYPVCHTGCDLLCVCAHHGHGPRSTPRAAAANSPCTVLHPQRCISVAPGCSSPIRRLTQALITLIVHFIRARLQGCRRIDAIGRVPHDAQALAIHRDLGKVLHIAEIDPQVRALLEPVRRRLHRFGVSAYRRRNTSRLHRSCRSTRPAYPA